MRILAVSLALVAAGLSRTGPPPDPNNYKDWKEYPILDIAFSGIK